MKTRILILLLALIAGVHSLSFAQTEPDTMVIIMDEEDDINDSTEITVGKNFRIIIGNNSKVNIGKNDNDKDDDDDSGVGFLGLDIGISNYAFGGDIGSNAAGDERLGVRPFRPGAHVALHLLPTQLNIIGEAVSIKTALTIDWNNYYFEDDITLVPRQDQLTILGPTADDSPFNKNKLTTRYFQIPLMLHFDTKPKADKGFSFSLGAYGGILWGAHTKQHNEDRELIKIRDDFNLNPWRYGLMARMDLRWLDIYVQYNLSEMFAKGEGPSTRTFNVGLNIIDF
ncbi:MAG: porin family protein [Bacteroidia bacterium]